MPAFDLFSIGHSNIPADRFIGMLRDAGVNAVADVRTTPLSRHFPWFSRKNLEARLTEEKIAYMSYGEPLGGRPRDPALFRDGVADYEAMARRPEFKAGIARLMDDAARCRVCMMCAEREPLDCHRCLLVARELAERGMSIGHILHDGAIEPHTDTEARLLQLDDKSGEFGGDLFATGQKARLAAAYRHRAHAVGFRARA